MPAVRADQVDRARRRARRPSRPTGRSSRSASVAAHRPPQPLAAGPAVGVGPPAAGVGQPAARTADQQQPHVLGAGRAARARGATAASNRDSASASRPHGPGCSISSQRWAGEAVATAESPRASACTEQRLSSSRPGGDGPARSVRQTAHRPVPRCVATAPIVPAPGAVAVGDGGDRLGDQPPGQGQPVGGVQPRQVADLELAGREQRGQRRPRTSAGKECDAPAGDQRRPGRRRRPGATQRSRRRSRSTVSGGQRGRGRRLGERRHRLGPDLRPGAGAQPVGDLGRVHAAQPLAAGRRSPRRRRPGRVAGRRGRGRAAASRAAPGRRRPACARGPARTRRPPTGSPEWTPMVRWRADLAERRRPSAGSRAGR